MRLIDADAMHKFVEEKVAEGKDGWVNGVPYEWAYALTAVDMQPTAYDIEEVVGELEKLKNIHISIAAELENEEKARQTQFAGVYMKAIEIVKKGGAE